MCIKRFILRQALIMSIYKKINYLRDRNQVLTVMRFSLFGGGYEIIHKK